METTTSEPQSLLTVQHLKRGEVDPDDVLAIWQKLTSLARQDIDKTRNCNVLSAATVDWKSASVLEASALAQSERIPAIALRKARSFLTLALAQAIVVVP